jgi:hypothetical protein
MLRDMGVVSFRLPPDARPVPQEVFAFGRSRGVFRLGDEMGTGARTCVTFVCSIAVVAPGG